MRVIEFSDGFTSSSAPTSGSVQQNSLASYADDAAFVTGKGSAAADGDAYYNTTTDRVRVYENSAWKVVATSVSASHPTSGALVSYADDAAFVTGKGSSAANGDAYYNSTEHAVKSYQNGAWHFLKTAVMASYATVAAFVTGKGSSAAAGDVIYHSGLASLMAYLGSDWAQILSADQGLLNHRVINGKLSWSVGSSALTVALKTKAGSDPSANDPVFVVFRSTTATDSVWVVRKVTAALSVVVSSGSTLAHASSRECPIYAYFVDNSGTVELGVCAVTLDEGQLIDTTAEGGAGAADSAHLLYTTTARTSKAICFAGKAISNQATAGTWASAMTVVSSEPPQSHDYSNMNFSWSTLTNPTSAVSTQPSEGTKTVTFPQPGFYRVIIAMAHGHSNAYSRLAQYCTLGGTSSIIGAAFGAVGPQINGEPDNDENGAQTSVIHCRATAALQTVTLAPYGLVTYAGTNHYFYFDYRVERIR